MMNSIPTIQEKTEVWAAYQRRQPTRVPVVLGVNPRVILLDPSLNTDGTTFEQYFYDAATHVRVQIQFQRYMHEVLHRCTDWPHELPERWRVYVDSQNVYEAAYFGSPVRFLPDQVPSNVPWLTEENRQAVFDRDIEHPLDEGFFAERLRLYHEMVRVCEGQKVDGRAVEVSPYSPTGCDGPVTVACCLRGTDFLMDLIADPDYADRLLNFIIDAAIRRRRVFGDYWGERVTPGNWFADDSCQMLSVEMYRQQVLASHRRFYDSGPAGPRSMHMCGDATRLFPTIHRELQVTSFDTGYPVNHGELRRQLGPEVEIHGGPEVALLLNGTTERVYQRTRDILQSGVKEGGRFVLREGNNVPPRCPLANLEAMYAACLEYGRYD